MNDVTVQSDVAVARGGDRDLKVDIFSPAQRFTRAPGVLLLPGGGWRTCNRNGPQERYGYRLARRGYVCVAGEYRVMDEAPWPAQIQDVKALLRWMRASSDTLGIDPGRIVLGGSSAGGHLALMAAGTPNVPELEGDGGYPSVSSHMAAVIAIYPVSDMTSRAGKPELEPFLGKNPSPGLIRSVSPIEHVTPNFPPTMLVHGTNDPTVPHSMTLEMYAALERAGVPVDLHLFAGQPHIFDQDPQFSEPIAETMNAFITRYVPQRTPVAAD